MTLLTVDFRMKRNIEDELTMLKIESQLCSNWIKSVRIEHNWHYWHFWRWILEWSGIKKMSWQCWKLNLNYVQIESKVFELNRIDTIDTFEREFQNEERNRGREDKLTMLKIELQICWNWIKSVQIEQNWHYWHFWRCILEWSVI